MKQLMRTMMASIFLLPVTCDSVSSADSETGNLDDALRNNKHVAGAARSTGSIDFDARLLQELVLQVKLVNTCNERIYLLGTNAWATPQERFQAFSLENWQDGQWHGRIPFVNLGNDALSRTPPSEDIHEGGVDSRTSILALEPGEHVSANWDGTFYEHDESYCSGFCYWEDKAQAGKYRLSIEIATSAEPVNSNIPGSSDNVSVLLANRTLRSLDFSLPRRETELVFSIG